MEKQYHLRLDEAVMNQVKITAALQDMTVKKYTSYVSEVAEATSEYGICAFRFIDLFAGIGGLRIAFERAGGKCVFSSEYNKFSKETYAANFLEMPKGDITQIHEKLIPDHDLLVAGFPCQPFSIAGVSKKKSLGKSRGFLDKTQGTLFFDIVRILRHKRPLAFLLENVKNLTSHDKGNTFQIISETLHNLGYEMFYQVLEVSITHPSTGSGFLSLGLIE